MLAHVKKYQNRQFDKPFEAIQMVNENQWRDHRRGFLVDQSAIDDIKMALGNMCHEMDAGIQLMDNFGVTHVLYPSWYLISTPMDNTLVMSPTMFEELYEAVDG